MTPFSTAAPCRRSLLVQCGVAVGSVGLAGCLFADDGESDRGDPLDGTVPSTQYDVANTGSTRAHGPSDPTLRWTADVDVQTGQPLLVEETFVCRSSDARGDPLYGVDTATGTIRWETNDDGFYDGTGVLVDETLIAHRYSPGSDEHELVALDRSRLQPDDATDSTIGTDAIQWRTENDHRLRGDPVSVDELVYVATEGDLYALDADTGDVEWRTDHRPSTPVAADSTGVYVGTLDGEFVGVRDSGEILFVVDLGHEPTTAPTVAGDTLLIGDVGGTLTAVDHDGSKRWHAEGTGPLYGSPGVAGGVVYSPRFDGTILARSLDDGGERWRFDAGGDHRRSFVTDVTRGQESLYAASDDGQLFAIDGGETRWSVELGGAPVGAPLVADGAVAIVTDDHELRVYDDGDSS